MFNFTTTTLIHSLDQFAANPSTDAQGKTEFNLGSSVNTFWVNGVNLFRKENVAAIYRSPYVDPLAGRLVVDVNKIFKAATSIVGENHTKLQFRLKFFLRRSGDNSSYYARDEVFKGKDFIYEWIGTDSAGDNAVKQVAKQIKKINQLYGDVYLDVHVGTDKDDAVLKNYDTVDGSKFGKSQNGEVDEMQETGKLVFVNDNFGLFTDAVIQVWSDAVSDCCTYREGQWIDVDRINCYDKIQFCNCSMTDVDCLYRGVKESDEHLLHIVDCVNGTGTYDQILRDLRLPTMENLGYMSLTQQMREMPVPGNKYVQYTLHYVSCRGVLGGSAVGEVTHSKTTHVFFVPADCCECANNLDTAFREAIETAFGVQLGQGGNFVVAPHDDPTLEPYYYGQLAPVAAGETRTSNDTAPATEGNESTEPVNP